MAHAWKACWCNSLTSSNLVSSARRSRKPLRENGFRAFSFCRQNADKNDGEPIEETTREKCRQYLRGHLSPVLGALPMASIMPDGIERWEAISRGATPTCTR